MKNSITIKKVLRDEKEYRFSDMTKVEVDDDKIVIFAHDKMKVKIAVACRGCSALIERLQGEDIPFYRKGE